MLALEREEQAADQVEVEFHLDLFSLDLVKWPACPAGLLRKDRDFVCSLIVPL
jgi:hypothetical protein